MPCGAACSLRLPLPRHHLAVALIAHDHLGQAVDGGLDLRHVDVLAAAACGRGRSSAAAMSHRHVARRERVGDGPARADGGAVGPARQVVEARERRALAAEAGIARAAARSARRGSRRPSPDRAFGGEASRSRAPSRAIAPGAKFSAHDVGPVDQLGARAPIARLLVERSIVTLFLFGFISTNIGEPSRPCGLSLVEHCTRRRKSGRVARLDLHDGGAVVGEVAGGDRSGGAGAELEHPDAGEDPAPIGQRSHGPARDGARAGAATADAASAAISAQTSALCSPMRGARPRTPMPRRSTSRRRPGARRWPRAPGTRWW